MRIPEGILEEIFESIKEENNLEVEKEITHYLSKLKSNLVEVRNAYWNDLVKIDYKDKKNQEVYLIAYFPLYTVPIFKVLEYIKKEHPEIIIPQNLCLIGAGPAPEMMGFLKFINNQSYENGSKIKIELKIELIEIASEWKYARKILKRVYNNKNILKNFKTKFRLSKLKIYKNDVSKEISNSSVLLRRFSENQHERVVVIQNIINEIEPQYHKVFIENVIKCYKNLVPGSLLILIDLKYPIVPKVASKLESKLEDDLIKSFGSSVNYEVDYANIILPELIKNNFFDSHGFGAKRKVQYGYGIFYKQK